MSAETPTPIHPEQFVNQYNSAVAWRDAEAHDTGVVEENLNTFQSEHRKTMVKLGATAAGTPGFPDRTSNPHGFREAVNGLDNSPEKQRLEWLENNIKSENLRGIHAKDNNEKAEFARKAALWDGHEDFRQNQEAYIEQARQEAEAQGVHINLESPKE